MKPSSRFSALRGLMARHGVFLRVFFAIGASVIAAIALSGALFWIVMDQVWEDLYDRDLGDLQSKVEQSLRRDNLRSLQSRVLRDEGVGLVVFKENRPIGMQPPRWLMQQLSRARHHDAAEVDRRMQRYVYASFNLGGERYRIFLLPNIRSVGQFARPLGVLLAFATLVLASAWIAWMLTRPLRILNHSTKQLAEGNLQARVPARLAARQDAIGQLGSEFNRMASRVDGLLGSQQQLLRDVSHELRTPLARLQVALTLAQDEPQKTQGMLVRMEDELARLDQLIGQVLSLSRLQSGTETLALAPIDLVTMLEGVGADAEFEFAERGVRVRLASPPVRVNGDCDKLTSAIENIVRNAMRYSPEEGVVEMRVQVANGLADISISDRGPGVDASKLERLFEAFYRVDGARHAQTGGHGVGLAIAREAITRHGGTLTARNRDGGGLVVTASLPVIA